MPVALCKPARDSRPQTKKVIGLAVTHRNAEREQVFRAIDDPACRLATLLPVCNQIAFDSWRQQAMLPPGYTGYLKVWPVEATLYRGVELTEHPSFKSWYAEHCVNGFLDADPELVDAVAEMLTFCTGIVVRPPGERTTLIVSDEHFGDCVEIGEPKLISGPS